MAAAKTHPLILFFALPALAGIPVAAQTLTAADMFKLGDTATLSLQPIGPSHSIDFDAVWKDGGAGKTWEFSTQGWSTTGVPYLFRAASETGRAVFADAQINEYAVGITDKMFSFSAGKDTLYYLGHTIGSNYRYYPSFAYLTFPLKLGDSVRYASKLYATAALTLEAGTLERSFMLDGAGTLKHGSRTYPDVLRIRTWQKDSSSVLKMATIYEEIIWMRKGGGAPVFRLGRTTTPLAGTGVAAAFLSQGGSGIPSRADRARGGVSFLPIRGGSELEISLPGSLGSGGYRVTLRGLDGNVVRSGHGSPRRISLAGLPPGVLIAEASRNGIPLGRALILR